MFSLLIPLLMYVDSLNTVEPMRVDTIHEVTVVGTKELQVETIMKRTIKQDIVIPPPSLGDILDRIKPGLKDKILYPLAFRERRREKRHRRMMEALDRYDRVRSFNELLHEAYEQQMIEDSIAALRSIQTQP